MAILSQITTHLHSTPFHPFALRMNSGEEHVVKHPDYIAISPKKDEITVYSPSGVPAYLNVSAIESMKRIIKSLGRPKKS